MSKCPKCHSRDIHRSHTRSRWERWRREITAKRPYRCRACHWRGWLPSGSGPSIPRPSVTPEPSNLQGTFLARPDPHLAFDIKELDRFHTLARSDGAEGA